MGNTTLRRIKRLILSLKEHGAIDEATSVTLTKQLRDLEHGLSVRNHKAVEKAISRICQILLELAG